MKKKELNNWAKIAIGIFCEVYKIKHFTFRKRIHFINFTVEINDRLEIKKDKTIISSYPINEKCIENVCAKIKREHGKPRFIQMVGRGQRITESNYFPNISDNF